jgi:hypothetical protein
MAHGPMHVTGVQGPTERLRRLVTRIDDARNVMHLDVAGCTPLLDSKVLDVNVTGARRRLVLIDHGDCSFVVNVQGSGLGLGESKLGKH